MQEDMLFNSRYFNSISVDELRGCIVKTSIKKEKLEDEYHWFLNIPEELRIFTPRIIDFKDNGDTASLTMERYAYPPLSELFVHDIMNFNKWELVMNRLFEVHELFKNYNCVLNENDLMELYYDKTINRINELRKQNSYWNDIFNCENISVNDRIVPNISFYLPRLENAVKRLLKHTIVSVMHGDFCFSNILFDIHTGICRLIDPRGRLKERSIYGDSRYDIAKLRHSVVGKYDFVICGQYVFSEHGNLFKYIQPWECEKHAQLDKLFDSLVVEHGYDLMEIKFIEALLFLSMIPLHQEDFTSQKVFYLKSIVKLNECKNFILQKD